MSSDLAPSRFPNRLLEALTEPTKSERTAVVVILIYTLIWTLYGILAKGSQDINFDMAEQFAWSRDLAFGYAKHPPLAAVVVKAWFLLFPATDWAFYLLAMTMPAIALWVAWRISARYLDGPKRVIGLAMLTLVPFFNFHALKFNVNTVLLPLWAITTLWFLRSYETERLTHASLAGLAAAASVYGKYWSVFLLAGLGLAAVLDSRRLRYFRSWAPYVTVAAGTAALAPHFAWLVANDFEPFSYAVAVHAADSVVTAASAAFGYVAGSIAYIAGPLAILFLRIRPTMSALADSVWPPPPDRRIVALAFWAPLLLPPVIGIVTGFQVTSLWTMSAWTLLPVVLLGSPAVSPNRRDVVCVMWVAVVFPFVMLASAPAIAFTIQRIGQIRPEAMHSALLAKSVEQLWTETTSRPLRLFASVGEFTVGVAFYLPSHPMSSGVQDYRGIDSGAPDQRILRDGIAVACPASDMACVMAVTAWERRSAESKRREVETVRSYWGAPQSMRFLIVAIPPANNPGTQ